MPYYRFSWIQNAVTTYWWVENLEDDDEAAGRADEIMDAEGASQADAQREDADPSELPAEAGGVDWEPATSEEIRIVRQEAEREGESVPLIPPEELIL